MFSILIVAKNEASCIEGCLRSLAPCDDIVLYDSYSVDNTCEIAVHHGARVIRRPDQDLSCSFGGDEGFHRTWGVKEIAFKYSWVFTIDADERLNTSLISELCSIAASPHGRYVAYRLRRRDIWGDHHLRYVQASPWFIRFFRPESISYDRLINCRTVVSGAVGQLYSSFDHYPFVHGLSHWIDKHNSYSTSEARQILVNRHNRLSFSPYYTFFCGDVNQRRYHQKELFYRLPARPLFKFILLYFFKLGFLDGRAGLAYSLLQSFYELLIVLKVKELTTMKVLHD